MPHPPTVALSPRLDGRPPGVPATSTHNSADSSAPLGCLSSNCGGASALLCHSLVFPRTCSGMRLGVDPPWWTQALGRPVPEEESMCHALAGRIRRSSRSSGAAGPLKRQTDSRGHRRPWRLRADPLRNWLRRGDLDDGRRSDGLISSEWEERRQPRARPAQRWRCVGACTNSTRPGGNRPVALWRPKHLRAIRDRLAGVDGIVASWLVALVERCCSRQARSRPAARPSPPPS
jgi:hypothetical protein